MFLDMISNRRSIRKFKNKSVEKEKISVLIEAALRSPSSRDMNPWQFIVVEDREILNKLSESKPHGSSFLKNAPLGIIICGDSSKTDVWIEDCSIAAIFVHLAAHDIGLGSCWIQIRNREQYKDKDFCKSADQYIKEILNISEPMMVEAIMAIGYPDEIKKPHDKDSLDFHKVLDAKGQAFFH
jgi:nitroreductase